LIDEPVLLLDEIGMGINLFAECLYLTRTEAAVEQCFF
jgi:transcriptional regulator with AAA-type ATPase domain